MTILRLAESFKTMNRPDPTVTLFDRDVLWQVFDGTESVKDRHVNFQHNLYLSLQFVLLTFGIDIFDSL